MDDTIKNLYQEFSVYKRPEHFTDFEHCEECKKHDDTMLSANLETLNSEHLGGAGWAPFSFLTEEGFAYYMPRILELAASGALNKHGEPFVQQILFHLAPNETYDRFKAYTKNQSKAVYDVLLYMHSMQYEILEDYCSIPDMEKAIEYWRLKCI